MQQGSSNPYPSHHAMGYHSETRNIDMLLERYSKERETTVRMLTTEPTTLIRKLWTLEGPLGFDPRCLMRMGTVREHGQWPPHLFSCSQCKNLERLIDYRQGLVDRSFNIECGREVGTALIVRRVPNIRVSLLLKEDPELEEEFRVVSQKYEPYLPCLSKIRCSRHLRADNYTSTILGSWVLEARMRERGAPHIQRLYSAFVCGDDGYLVTEHLKGVEESGVLRKEEDVWSLFVQLVQFFRLIQELRVSCPDLKLSHLRIREFPISYKEGDYHVQGPWTLVLSPPPGLSFQSENLRVHSHLPKGRRSSELHIFHEGTGKTLYQVPDLFWNPVPLISGSYEFYCLLLQLMTISVVRSFVLTESSRLHKFWRMAWTSRDLDRLHREQQEDIFRTSPSGLHLKREILEELWEYIQGT